MLSIALPCFHKLRECERVLPFSARYVAHLDMEVVLVLYENSEQNRVLALLAQHSKVRWKVVVNDEPHPWRPPHRAINVGLRDATGHYVLEASPPAGLGR